METKDNKISILIIEDDADHAFVEKDVLQERLDCHVEIISRMSELTDELIDNAQIVLLDFNLPDSTGSEILKYIRKLSDIPVIMITADNQLETAVETLKGGATDFLVKSPENIDQLPKLVFQVLAGYKEARQKKEQERTDTKVETLRQVLTTLAHYINNSTTTIYGYAQLCQHHPEEMYRCKKLAEVSLKETRRISHVLHELEQFVTSTELKTTNYVNIPEAMFAIEENLKKKMETL